MKDNFIEFLDGLKDEDTIDVIENLAKPAFEAIMESFDDEEFDSEEMEDELDVDKVKLAAKEREIEIKEDIIEDKRELEDLKDEVGDE